MAIFGDYKHRDLSRHETIPKVQYQIKKNNYLPMNSSAIHEICHADYIMAFFVGSLILHYFHEKPMKYDFIVLLAITMKSLPSHI